ncbi:MAG: XdhC family protein [Eubacteriales bacterium]|nr:XdhC family protein [Eubacteriales bacterium]
MWEWLLQTADREDAYLLTGISEAVCGQKFYLTAADWVAARWQTLREAVSGPVEFEGEQWFLEQLGSRPKLYICGGGHVSMPIIGLARTLGFWVTVLEDRPYFADRARAAGADAVICEDFTVALRQIEGDADSYFVIVTRGHRFDQVCLREILAKPSAYVGMMGSKRRVAIVKQELAAEFAAERVAAVHAPIGLAIHAETPEEIAVSIMAELIAVKNSRFRTEGFTEEVREALLKNEAKVLATIISRRGSAPRAIGTKMVVFADGSIRGTVGGGCAEAEVIREARMMLLRGDAPKLFRVDMTADQAEEEGMVCGGVIEVLAEVVPEMEKWKK